MNKEKCETLQQARAQIDSIDQAITELIGLRQYYVDQAVRFKRTIQDVQSPERVEIVIEKIRELATKNGVDPLLMEKIYREMIQHFIQRELKEIRP
ncbi:MULTISPECIES: chorismate mutase [unclassified Acinetobacter]|uniref:chorismate mutase n=1 Tax=unclassified Acinetobacter TaxID=196816 RepID=UPI000451451A|nr:MULTISPECIES: chorismate mutase [unclassified Acinetobacter]EZQ01094.1 chorismate mutase [Acinetobacter sp. Ver3]